MTGSGRPPSRRALSVFLAFSAAYYALYYVVFARRLADYWADVLRHFAWMRQLFG